MGAPFVVVQVASHAARARAEPDFAAHRRLLPFQGALSVFAYVRDAADRLHARMFAPIDGIMEDPATGSAAAAAVALIAPAEGHDALFLQVHQGEEMGRPSLMLARAWHQHRQTHAQVGGACVAITEGTLLVE